MQTREMERVDQSRHSQFGIFGRDKPTGIVDPQNRQITKYVPGDPAPRRISQQGIMSISSAIRNVAQVHLSHHNVLRSLHED